MTTLSHIKTLLCPLTFHPNTHGIKLHVTSVIILLFFHPDTHKQDFMSHQPLLLLFYSLMPNKQALLDLRALKIDDKGPVQVTNDDESLFAGLKRERYPSSQHGEEGQGSYPATARDVIVDQSSTCFSNNLFNQRCSGVCPKGW